MMRSFGLFRRAYTHSCRSTFITSPRAAASARFVRSPGLHQTGRPVGMNYVQVTDTDHQGSVEQKNLKATTIEGANAKSLWGYLKEIRRAPVPDLTLGLAGLIPFVSVPAYLVFSHRL